VSNDRCFGKWQKGCELLQERGCGGRLRPVGSQCLCIPLRGGSMNELPAKEEPQGGGGRPSRTFPSS
jgi:hypothetical protein